MVGDNLDSLILVHFQIIGKILYFTFKPVFINNNVVIIV